MLVMQIILAVTTWLRPDWAVTLIDPKEAARLLRVINLSEKKAPEKHTEIYRRLSELED